MEADGCLVPITGSGWKLLLTWKLMDDITGTRWKLVMWSDSLTTTDHLVLLVTMPLTLHCMQVVVWTNNLHECVDWTGFSARNLAWDRELCLCLLSITSNLSMFIVDDMIWWKYGLLYIGYAYLCISTVICRHLQDVCRPFAPFAGYLRHLRGTRA
jgi:hypothetical protein